MFESIKRKIIGLLIGAGIFYIVIPALLSLFTTLSNIPSWVYYSCCGLGIIFGIIFTISDATYNKKQEKKEETIAEINEIIIKNFEDNLLRSPKETKKIYLEFLQESKKLERELNRNENIETPNIIEIKNHLFKLSDQLYGLKYFYKETTEKIEKFLRSFETTFKEKALEMLENNLEKYPDRTLEAYDMLIERVQHDPKLHLELSEKVFGDLLIIHRSVIQDIGLASIVLKKIIEANESDEAVKNFNVKVINNPNQTKQMYQEIIKLIVRIDKSTGRQGNNFQELFKLSEKVFGIRLDFNVIKSIINSGKLNL